MLERKTVETTIGKGFADRLDEPIMKYLGVTRRAMVEDLGCANFIAAARLDKVLRRLEIDSPAKLFKTNPMDLARVRGIGESAIFVAMCILDAGQYNVADWWGWRETNVVKFSSFKTNAMRKSRKSRHVA